MADIDHHTHHAHHHGHSAHDEPGADHDYVSANEAHFDAQAAEFDVRPAAQELAKRVSGAMRTTYPELFDEAKTEMLDFACGSGILSRELCSYVKSILGVDISQKMVDLYNLRVNQQGIPPQDMRAIRAMLTGDGTELDGAKFDAIVCVASYHHFPSIDNITRILSTFLKPGGSLLVADILKEDVNADEPELLDQYKHIVVHKSGFTESEIRTTLAGAGLVKIGFGVATHAFLHGKDVKFFLAKGVKA